MTQEPELKKSRRGGRSARRELRSAPETQMLPALKRNLPLVEPMNEEQIEKIDNASLDILEEVGVIFRDDVAVEDWRKAGADIRDGDRVHLDIVPPARCHSSRPCSPSQAPGHRPIRNRHKTG